MIPDPAKVKTGRKKYRRLVNKAKRGECTREGVDISWQTWINHLSKGTCKNLIQRLKKYYNDLWKGDQNNDIEETDNDARGTGCAGERGSPGCAERSKH